MAVDLKWRDAMCDWRIRHKFSADEQAQGWPCRMDAEQLAALQRPYVNGAAGWRQAQLALRDALQADCEACRLLSEVRVISVEVPIRLPDEVLFSPIPLTYEHDSDRYRSLYTPPQRFEVKECTRYLVAAADFAHWLREQDMQPSTHVSAWFKSCGVVMASATDVLQPHDVQDFTSLLQYRKQFASLPDQERPKWNASHVAVLAAWLQEQVRQDQARGALTRLEAQSGIRRQTLVDLLKRHGFNAKGERSSDDQDTVQQPAADLRSAVNGWMKERNG